MKDLSQLADEVLKGIEDENLVKQAASTYNKQQEVKTEVGQLMLKVAAQLKDSVTAEITYADIMRFRKEYDV